MAPLRMTLVGAALACGLALAGPAAAGAARTALRQKMLDAVNGARSEHGLTPFRGSASLHRSAGGYAHWMLRADYFGHLDRIRASSRFTMLGEALAWQPGGRPCVARRSRAGTWAAASGPPGCSTSVA
jgi:uncharacterized protein YkwD